MGNVEENKESGEKMKRSESIVEFAKALAGFNAEVGAIAKDAKNPFFKAEYLTLDKLIQETRPLLQKHGLSVMQFPSGDGMNVSVTTLLLHTSGEFIEADPLVVKPVKNDPQALGSAITYARRYAYQAVLSLNTGEDDDANSAAGKNKGGQQQNQPQNNTQGNNNTSNGISEGQVKAVNTNLNILKKEANTTSDKLIIRLEKEIGKFGSVSGMTKQQATQAITLLKKWQDATKASKQEG